MLSASNVYTITLRSICGPLTTAAPKTSLLPISKGPGHPIFSTASQQPTFRLHWTKHFTIALPSAEAQSRNLSSDEVQGDQAPEASLVRRVFPPRIKHHVRQANVQSDPKIKKQRLQAKKIEIHKTEKDFRNRMLKDKKGLSWSHDWRVPLRILEQHWAPERDQVPDLSPAVDVPSKIRVPHNVRADKIQRPTVWTRASFYDYVVQLSDSKVDRLVARQLYSKKENHIDAVADILESLFADSKRKYVFGTDAANCALRFFLKAGKYARANDLFSRFQQLQRNTHASTYNILLEAAADQKDLFNFTWILKMMVFHNVYPNSHSWLYLAQAVQSDEVRFKVVRDLIQKSPTHHPAILRKAVAVTFPDIVSKSLDSGKDPRSLLETFDSIYGPGWISRSICQYIIEEVGARYSPQQALTILDRLSAQGYQPSQGMMLLLLRRCSWTRDHELAIEVLRVFHTQFGIQASPQIYDVLFEQAWRSRLYNCCRVLWIHACVMGHTSFNMQQKVKRSLCVDRNLDTVEQPRAFFWEQTAGKVTAGCDRPNSEVDFWGLMSIWKPANDNRNHRDKFLRAVRAILANDLAAVGRLRISKPLDELLSEALRVDRRWAIGRALKEVPIECKYSQVMDVVHPGKSLHRLVDKQSQLIDDGANEAESTVEVDSKASNYCWMSPDMRLRPCRCPAYVKEGMHTWDVDRQDIQHQEDSKQCTSVAS